MKTNKLLNPAHCFDIGSSGRMIIIEDEFMELEKAQEGLKEFSDNVSNMSGIESSEGRDIFITGIIDSKTKEYEKQFLRSQNKKFNWPCLNNHSVIRI